MTPIRRLGCTSLALFTLVGCDAGVQTSAPPPSPATPSTGAATPGKPENDVKALPVEPGKKDGASVEKLSDKELAQIQKLPADQQAVAIAQVTCPVSDSHLGAMGMPIKQVVGDKTFYLCCSGCIDEVKEKPAEVLAKLKK